ncbi:MAG: sigma factor-like helix-turn-helix DNA-binding protein, partial [Thermoanaerobaculia bacterium]
VVDRVAAGGRLRRAVLALPEELRFTVTALFWGDLPVKEIARQEGVTTVAIRKRLKRALARLAQALGEEDMP